MLTPNEIINIVLASVFAPFILFFLFGMISVFVKSDISIPPAMSTALAIFLLVSIGLSGGRKAVVALMAHPDLLMTIVVMAIVAVICGSIFAFITANILKKVAGLKTADAWAAGGSYGAVSSVTLAVGVGIATAAQAAAGEGVLVFGGWMPALYPFMDSPALVTAILFGRMALAKEGVGIGVKIDTKKILHHSIFGMGVWLLGASLLIGAVSQYFSPIEVVRTLDFFGTMFRGVLVLFLLDMGLAAGKQLGALKELGSKIGIVVLIAFLLPQVWATVGILSTYAVNLMFPNMLGWADAFVFACIAGGCSYVTAPVAMRAAIPEANPSVYLSMALALTFPFNIIVGMTYWQILSITLWGI